MNPLSVQYYNFLMYIKNKFKLLVQKNTTVSLFVDEIHVKPYFGYNGTNISGLSDYSNETAASAFALMLNRVFSQYKDVAQSIRAVEYTDCTSAEG